MTYFIKNGESYRVTKEGSVDIRTHLPAGNYIIKKDPFENLYLEQIENFVDLPKYYGNTEKYAERIIQTFHDRDQSTGAMFTGEKGSGKSLLAKKISIECAKRNIPTILVSNPGSSGSTDGSRHNNNSSSGQQSLDIAKFTELVQEISQECVILFDEFEKNFSETEQNKILTLLDGVFSSKKLYLITCNDVWRINSFMRNRPGRVFYSIDFNGLEHNFIQDYCEDNLLDKSQIPSIIKISTIFASFNFDILKSIVEEMNRYGETPQEVLKILNARPEYDKSNNQTYEVSCIVDGNLIDSNTFYDKLIKQNPLTMETVCVSYDDDKGSYQSHVFNQMDIVSLDAEKGIFKYRQGNKELILTRLKDNKFDYWKAF